MPAAAPPLRPDVERFVDEMSTKHGLDRLALRRLFEEARSRPAIIRAMSTPGTARPWFEYRRRIVEARRIEAGVRFWAENAPALEHARRQFGVPEEIIVSTIGIETLYGRNTGNFKVLDALVTLAFDYPPRADFFRAELEEYLLLTRETGLDAAMLRGSYAGAIGIPQFLPSSYRKYAIDFDGDGRSDLVGSTSDAIGSIANYYQKFGWATDAMVALRIDSGDADLGALIAAGLRPHTAVRDLRKRGLVVPPRVDDNAEAAVFTVENEAGPELWLGLNNFYVITRYNRSVNYAMAVYELAQAIRAEMKSGLVPSDGADKPR